MEQIKLTQSQTLSLASSYLDNPASVSTCIDESLIADEVLGVQQGQCKGMGQIVKRKGKASCSSLTFSSRLQSQAEQQRRIDERFDAQQREIEALKTLIAQMTATQSQPSSQPPPKDEEDLGRHQFQVLVFKYNTYIFFSLLSCTKDLSCKKFFT